VLGWPHSTGSHGRIYTFLYLGLDEVKSGQLEGADHARCHIRPFAWLPGASLSLSPDCSASRSPIAVSSGQRISFAWESGLTMSPITEHTAVHQIK
jgi:hypothetical protein